MTATEETRQMFEQLLKKTESRKKRKDKKPVVTEKENELVESLERSLRKDDPLAENNTYDEEAEKNLKNLRNSGQMKGKENRSSSDNSRRKKFSPHPAAAVSSERYSRKNSKSPMDTYDSLQDIPSAFGRKEFASTQRRNSLPSDIAKHKSRRARRSVTFDPSLFDNENPQEQPSSTRKLTVSDLRATGRGTKGRSRNRSHSLDMNASVFPISVTVLDIHSVGSAFDRVWDRHADYVQDKSIMSSLGKNGWRKVKSILRTPDKSLHSSDLRKQRTMCEQVPVTFTVTSSPSEPDIYKAVWESISHEYLSHVSHCSDTGFQSSTPRAAVDRVRSFESFEKLLIREYETQLDKIGEKLIEPSDAADREKFWKDFWQRQGVEIDYGQGKTRLIEEADDPTKKVPKGKKKKVKKKEEPEPVKEEEANVAVDKPKGKKKSKPVDGAPDQDDGSTKKPKPRKPRSKSTPEVKVDEDEATEPKSVEEEADETTAPKAAVRRKKKTKKGASRALPRADGAEGENQEAEGPAADAPAEEQIEDDGTILGVTVHHCDYIRVDPKFVAHPVVKVSIVDAVTGKYINKFDSARHVSSYYESDTVSTIVPLMTQPYDFKLNRSLLPRWEEQLLFNESFARLTSAPTSLTASKPILFFVIRDFVAMEKANNVKGGSEKGWHNVAWAFLKLVSNNGQPNAGRKMRLQLFHPPRSGGWQDPSAEQAHNWWLNHPRQRYPGTLYVTIKAIPLPGDMASSLRSLSALQREESSLTYNQLNESLERSASESQLRDQLDDLAEMQQWSRLPGQTCKIPNAPMLRLWAGSDGAFTMQFSHRGTRLAVACRHEATYPILLYSIPSGDEIGVITGHQQLVYDLEWSKNDQYLLSASADGTAQVWDVSKREKPIQTLPHPSYVYTASYHPIASHLIATGGYDSTVRVWNTASQRSQLTQELDVHKVMINSIIFDSTGLNMFSGDGAGIIVCWDCRSHEKAKKNIKTNWTIKYKIEDKDLAGVCVNSLRLHPRNNKILIHCRDSSVRLLDSRIHSIKKFTGLVNYRQLLRSSLTPCGSLIFSGSEDGCVYVWNVDTGDQVAKYDELGYQNAVHSVIYHPHDHIVAFCSYAASQSILLYKFNSAVATMEAGFKPIVTIESQEDDTTMSVSAHVEAAKGTVTLNRIKNQLDSVLEVADEGDRRLSNTEEQLPADPPSRISRSPSPYKLNDSLSNLDSSFETGSHMRGSVLAPSFLSPHASPDARAVANQYIRAGRRDQRSVVSVGGSPYKTGVAPDLSFTTGEDGQQVLQIQAPPGSQQQSLVVVLFEYEACRSDELSVIRGDLIKVLYKDSPNWWFGEKASDGKQGYFPSTYVEEQVSTGQIQQSHTQTPVFGVPDRTPDKKVYALKMPGGRLNFYSQSESEGDEDRLSNSSVSSRQRRREARLQDSLGKSQPSPLTKETTPSKTNALNQPKSILIKESGRPKTPDVPSIKEVSFADEKNDKNPEERQTLMESIQAALKQTEREAKSASDKSPRSEKTELSTKRKTAPRKAPQRKPRGKNANAEETSFTENQASDANGTTTSKLAPTFGILKSVQALMKESENSQFSQSVVGGHGVSTPTKSNDDFKPVAHSTAVKKGRYPVENEEGPVPSGSTVRKARPLPKISAKQVDDETIPLVRVSRSKSSSAARKGATNPAFTSEA